MAWTKSIAIKSGPARARQVCAEIENANTQTHTCGLLKICLLLLFDGLCVIVCCAFVHGQGRDLLVGLPTMVAVVGLAGRVDHVVLV